MVMAEIGIPEALWVKIRGFLRDGKTGSVTLDVQDGVVRSWEITEAGKPPSRCPDCGSSLKVNNDGPGGWCQRCRRVVG